MLPDETRHTPPRKKNGHRMLLIVIAVILIVLVAWGILSRMHHEHALKRRTNDQSLVSVTIVQAKEEAMLNEIVLPGSVHAWHEASLSARVSGYLKTWSKDIGDHVKAGDVLATIDTPETDAQLRQADADLTLAIANSQLAQITAKRWLALLKTDSVTRQETDEKVADAKAKEATVASETASRDRLREEESFKSIIAPFDGVVTNRATDIGALINENGSELYHLATVDQLRIYVQVPQNYTQLLRPGITADLFFDDHPGEHFPATLLSTSGSIDASTRTLLAEFALPNPGGRLFPGGYAQVHIKVPDQAQTMRLPVNAFIFQSEGLQVDVVGQDNRIQIKAVKPGRDFGTTIEVLSGIGPEDRIVINPPDSAYNGEPVRIAPEPKPDGGEQQQKSDDDQKKNDQKKQDGSSDKDDSKNASDSSGQNSSSGQGSGSGGSANSGAGGSGSGGGPTMKDGSDKQGDAQSGSDTGKGNAAKKNDQGEKKKKNKDPNTRDDSQ